MEWWFLCSSDECCDTGCISGHGNDDRNAEGGDGKWRIRISVGTADSGEFGEFIGVCLFIGRVVMEILFDFSSLAELQKISQSDAYRSCGDCYLCSQR